MTAILDIEKTKWYCLIAILMFDYIKEFINFNYYNNADSSASSFSLKLNHLNLYIMYVMLTNKAAVQAACLYIQFFLRLLLPFIMCYS